MLDLLTVSAKRPRYRSWLTLVDLRRSPFGRIRKFSIRSSLYDLKWVCSWRYRLLLLALLLNGRRILVRKILRCMNVLLLMNRLKRVTLMVLELLDFVLIRSVLALLCLKLKVRICMMLVSLLMCRVLLLVLDIIVCSWRIVILVRTFLIVCLVVLITWLKMCRFLLRCLVKPACLPEPSNETRATPRRLEVIPSRRIRKLLLKL